MTDRRPIRTGLVGVAGAVGVAGMSIACGCPEAGPIAVTAEAPGVRAGVVDAVRGAVGDFQRWTGGAPVCVEAVAIVDAEVLDAQEERARSAADRDPRLYVSATAPSPDLDTLHALCHALDADGPGISRAHPAVFEEPILLGTPAPAEPHARWLAREEGFAVTCARGPRISHWFDLLGRCAEYPLSEAEQIVLDEVYGGFIGEPPVTRGPGVALEEPGPLALTLPPANGLWLGSAGGRLLAVRMGIRDREGEPGVRDGVAIDELWPDPALGRVTLPDLPEPTCRLLSGPGDAVLACTTDRYEAWRLQLDAGTVAPLPGWSQTIPRPHGGTNGEEAWLLASEPDRGVVGLRIDLSTGAVVEEPIAVEGTIEAVLGVMGDEDGAWATVLTDRGLRLLRAEAGGGGWSAEAPPPVAGLPGVPVPIGDGRALLTFAEPGPERDPAAPHRGLLVRDDGGWTLLGDPCAEGWRGTAAYPAGDQPVQVRVTPAEDGYAVQTRAFAPSP